MPALSTATLSPADPFDAGPYVKALAALHLIRPGSDRLAGHAVIRRALVLAAVAWIPLVVLGTVQGLAIGPTPRESVLLDLAAYSRYVVALPLLVFAEAVCLPQLAAIAHEFANSGLIPDSQIPKYESLLASTRRLLETRWVEILLAALAYTLAIASVGTIYPREISTWVAPIGPAGREISLAGWWRLFISQPLFLLVLAAWLERIGLWARFLWVVSRMNLRLIPSHPDRVGGLRFLALSLRGFRWFAGALGAAAAGSVSQAFFFDHRPLKSFQPTVIALLVVVLLLTAGPLLVFYRPLYWARARGVLSYGKLAGSLGRQFQNRWLAKDTVVDGEALSLQDFSATTDMFSVAANVYSMALIPFTARALIPLVYMTVIPFVPVLLAVLPLKELLAYAVKLLL